MVDFALRRSGMFAADQQRVIVSLLPPRGWAVPVLHQMQIPDLRVVAMESELPGVEVASIASYERGSHPASHYLWKNRGTVAPVHVIARVSDGEVGDIWDWLGFPAHFRSRQASWIGPWTLDRRAAFARRRARAAGS